MKELVPLIRLISKKKISDKYILKSNSVENKQDKLFFAIKSGKIESDEDALKLLYGKEGNRKAYMRMKRRLKDKLYNSMVNLDQSKQRYSSLKKANYKVMKQYIIANLLRIEGQSPIMAILLEDTLKQAIKYEMTEYVKLISKQLVQHYSIRTQNDRKLDKFKRIYKEYSKIEDFEFKANMYYYELSKLYTKKVSKKGEFMEKLKSYSEELTLLQEEVLSFDFNHKAYSINSTRYVFVRAYEKAIENANEALIFFNQKPFETVKYIFTFNSDKIIALILLRRHMEAENLIHETITKLGNKTFNYFRLQYYSFLNFSISKQYESLPLVINKVLKNNFIKSYNVQYEMWKIREAYVQFLIEGNVIDALLETSNSDNKFRLARFINEVPIYSKEKRGMNVSILVIQLLFFIVRRQYSLVIDRIDALKQYSFRYLRKDDTFRSNCFIKMLIKIPGADFHPVRTELHTRDLFEKLKAHDLDIQELTNEIEVIPFHDLWPIILNVLEKNRK